MEVSAPSIVQALTELGHVSNGLVDEGLRQRLGSAVKASNVLSTGLVLAILESLFLRATEPKPGYRYCERSGRWKRYVKPADGFDTFLGGIMECIKYHFQPMAMYEDGRLDFDLIKEILPAIKGKPLYRKFGAFHAGTKNAHPGAKMLNINYKEDDNIQALAEDLAETGHEEVVNPETGEPALREEYQYFVVNLAKVFIDPEDEHRIKIDDNVRRKYLPAHNALDALVDMELMAQARQRAVRNKPVVPGVRRKRGRRRKSMTAA